MEFEWIGQAELRNLNKKTEVKHIGRKMNPLVVPQVRKLTAAQ